MGFFDSGIGQIVGAGLSIVPGVGSFLGQASANSANRDIASDANAMSQSNAREQMAFQERMANTSHAREVADLKNAGLNPILSVNAGAASPGGASGSVATSTMQNTMAGGASSAMEMIGVMQQYKKQKKELELMESQKNKLDVDAKVASKGIPEADLKNKAYKIIQPWVDKISEGMNSKAKPLPQKYKGPNINDFNRDIPNPWKKN